MAKKDEQESPLKALKFLDGILASVSVTRADHAAIKGAVGIVATALEDSE